MVFRDWLTKCTVLLVRQNIHRDMKVWLADMACWEGVAPFWALTVISTLGKVT